MIARASSSAEFAPLARYLATDRDTAPARVAWTDSRNLVTTDPALAADLMQATAAQNLRVTNPVYHLTLSFAPEDHPSPELVREVADHTLRALGLAEHQTVLVAHQDRAHTHVHLMVNRVQPVTLAAWDRWHDHSAIQQILYDQERALGLRQVSGRPDRSADRAPDDPTSPDRTSAKTRSAVDGSLVDRVCVHLPEIRAAKTWDELRDRLADRGLSTDRRAKGLVITDGTSAVPASAVAADVSLARLEARLGAYPRDQERAISRVSEPSRATFELARERDALAARLRQIEWTVARASRSAADLVRSLVGVYVDPVSAKLAFDDAVREHGAGRAVSTLRDTPEAFGTLTTADRPRALGLWHAADDREARAAARQLVPRAREATDYAYHARHALTLSPGASHDAVASALDTARSSTRDAIHRIEIALARLHNSAPTAPVRTRDLSRGPEY
jgi:hypothetical protein